MTYRIGAAGRHTSSPIFSAVSRRLSDESFEDLHGEQSKLSSEEWTKILQSVVMSGIAVSAADRSGER